MNRLFRFPGALVLLLALACADDPLGVSGPVPGSLELALGAPAAVGAVSLVIEGPSLGPALPADPSYVVFSERGDTGLRIAVVGERLGGALVRIAVPDIRNTAPYGVTLLEAAGQDNEPMADLSHLRIAVRGVAGLTAGDLTWARPVGAERVGGSEK
jgi:hypothetical protein